MSMIMSCAAATENERLGKELHRKQALVVAMVVLQLSYLSDMLHHCNEHQLDQKPHNQHTLSLQPNQRNR